MLQPQLRVHVYLGLAGATSHTQALLSQERCHQYRLMYRSVLTRMMMHHMRRSQGTVSALTSSCVNRVLQLLEDWLCF